MKPYEIALVGVAALVILFLLYSFLTAKGANKKVTIANPDGSSVDVQVEVADTPLMHMKGLMGRKSLGETEGMLFVFQNEGIYPFWMLNTTIPLDAIYADKTGTIVEVIAMEPCGFNITDCKVYRPINIAKYVLEVNMGFSKTHDLSIGKSRIVLDSTSN